tara:strand:- start:1636 stop:1773 length:138 start_codon:yes stop_codon:yes gene_type:complete
MIYIGFLTFQLAQGWGQGQDMETLSLQMEQVKGSMPVENNPQAQR